MPPITFSFRIPSSTFLLPRPLPSSPFLFSASFFPFDPYGGGLGTNYLHPCSAGRWPASSFSVPSSPQSQFFPIHHQYDGVLFSIFSHCLSIPFCRMLIIGIFPINIKIILLTFFG
jgi:hypothetical protein